MSLVSIERTTRHKKPYSPASRDIVYNLDMILHLILLRHPISRTISLPQFHKSEPGQQQNKYAIAWKITKDIIYDLGLKMVMKMNANFAETYIRE